MVTENGLYKLIMRSDKPVASPSITGVILADLPALRPKAALLGIAICHTAGDASRLPFKAS